MITSITQNSVLSSAVAARKQITGHRIRVCVAAAAAALLALSLAIYGADYYILPLDQRPYSAKHLLLRPSGAIGLKLGVFGTILFFVIFLYVLRKFIPWLNRLGTARQWMDFHVIAGVTAPIVIAFHASFKFQGLAGAAFWIMLAVAFSGVVGRYLYAQIPRTLSAVELSLTELSGSERDLADALLQQHVYSASQLDRVLRVPSPEHIRRIGAVAALGKMLVVDLVMPFRIASLRRAPIGFAGILLSLGGFRSAGDPEMERVVQLVRQKARLSKRVVFLDQTRKVFHLWHVIHRPFSYAFVILALIHIAVVMGLGFAGGLGLLHFKIQ